MEEVRANSMSNVNNALIGIQGAFAAPSRQSTESAKQAKPPTQAEIRAQQEQQQRTQQTLQRANMATGGILDDNICQWLSKSWMVALLRYNYPDKRVHP
jgi:hypothetical protein